MSDAPATPASQASQSAHHAVIDLASSPALASGSSFRKERGAIAAQACDTCRSRKQRCDEQRPKCGTCQKFNLECHYREPQPTKKDRTLVEILDRIKSLEDKIDILSHHPSASPSSPAFPQQTSLVPSPGLSVSAGPLFQFPEAASVTSEDGHYQYVSSVHRMLQWPAIQQLFASVQAKRPTIDFSALEREGPASMLAFRRSNLESLPTDIEPRARRGSDVSLHDAPPSQDPVTVANLDWDTMRSLSKAYFDTFNLFCPILERQSFMSVTLPALFNNGFSSNTESTIAFLVFAIGEVALAGADGHPVHAYCGRPSGVKGGTKDRPPGMELFNEARGRMGFHLTQCSLENVQIFELARQDRPHSKQRVWPFVYYGTCFYPLEFWRMNSLASLACQALITSCPGALSTEQADLTRRVFWHCSVMETCLYLELGFPLTGLDKLESAVGLPDFSGPFSQEDYICNQESHFQEHFASQIVMRRLLVGFHGTLSQGAGRSSSAFSQIHTPFSPATTTGATGSGVNPGTIRQLALQLEQWRGMLPAHLRWHESPPGALPRSTTDLYSTPSKTPVTPAVPAATGGAHPPAAAPVVPVPVPVTISSPLMFTTDLDAPPPRYPYVVDVQVALLRSKYYYTKYMIHRPFLYKALHHPDTLARDDAVGVAECLRSCLLWPVAMSPTCRHKRLVPCSFFFTQNFFGILVLLHLSGTVPMLRRIRNTLCGENFERDAAETVALYLDWLRDLKAVDPGTEWHWEVIRTLYGLDE
ncbi:hypothetical protein N658DRAFT_422348 [Parathielavia hyrcaniae]|uniref:Zn(2)-C6 fungal-type domain-containing protein n=1 Tax=Parathielavia hyrcaniae TaxID=113614 RepID=A0AAN6Q544_9PEZI|nr:hypothetical protein N658DRAFT_422348 [Parathielavia hyrcaniae]